MIELKVQGGVVNFGLRISDCGFNLSTYQLTSSTIVLTKVDQLLTLFYKTFNKFPDIFFYSR